MVCCNLNKKNAFFITSTGTELGKTFLSEKIKPGDTAVVDVDKNGTVKVLLGENYSVVA